MARARRIWQRKSRRCARNAVNTARCGQPRRTGESQKSLNDPDCRAMTANGELVVGYDFHGG